MHFRINAIYVILGRALATGAGYRYVHLPGSPPAVHYPPGYPVFLSLLWRVAPNFPGNVVTFERANAVLLAIAAVLGFELARRRAGLSTVWSAVVALAGTISILPLAFASMVLSESLFLVVLLAALLAAEWLVSVPPGYTGDLDGRRMRRPYPAIDDTVRSVRDGGVSPSAGAPGGRSTSPFSSLLSPLYGRAAAVGVLCGSVALVRSIGIMIVPAALAVCAWRGRWRPAAALAVGAAAVLVPWQVWVWSHTRELAPMLQGEYGPYATWVAAALHRRGLGFAMRTVTGNSLDVAQTLGATLATRLPNAIRSAAAVTWLALLVAGMGWLVRRTTVTVIFCLLYVGAVLLWPFPPHRFISAIWLLIMMALVAGVVAVVQWRPELPLGRGTRMVALALVVLLGVGTLRYNMIGYRHGWWGLMRESLTTRVARPLDWLVAHPTLPGPTMSSVEPSLYLYAHRAGLPCSPFVADNYVYPRDTAQDRATLAAALRRHRVGSIIATDPVCALAASRLAAEPAPLLTAVDTSTVGMAVFVRTSQ